MVLTLTHIELCRFHENHTIYDLTYVNLLNTTMPHTAAAAAAQITK